MKGESDSGVKDQQSVKEACALLTLFVEGGK
jgi:hypothetical protein